MAARQRPPPPNIPDPSTWALDPLYWTHLRLFNSEIVYGLGASYWNQILEESLVPCEHFLPASRPDGLVRPVTRGLVLGRLVASFPRRETLKVYTLDDGTALLDCLLWASDDYDSDYAPPVGTLCRAVGRFDFPPTVSRKGRSFARRRQLVLFGPLERVEDPNEEAEHAQQVMSLWKSIYSQPSPISPPSVPDTQLPAPKRARSSIASPSSLEDVVSQILRLSPPMPLLGPTNLAKGVNIAEAMRVSLFDLEGLAQHPRVSEVMTSLDELASLVEKLARAGFVFNADHEARVYAVITHEWALAPAIVSFLAKKDPFRRGTSREAILDHFHEDPRLGRVPESRVDLSIGRLLVDSVVYEVDHGSICLI